MQRLRYTLLVLAALAGFLGKATATVYLTSYNFTTNNLPQIWADDSLPEPYRLRAKISGSYHATGLLNNQWTQLQSVPGPGTYTVELYWVTYDSDETTVLEVGPFNTQTITIQSPNSGPVPSISVDGYSHGNTITRPYNGSTSITVRYSATDANGNLSGIRYNVWNPATGYFDNGGGGYISQSGYNGQVVRTVNLSDDGDWYFWTDAIDGNNATSSTGDWGSGFRLAVQRPPQTESMSATNALLGQNTTITGSASDPNGNLQWMFFYVNPPPNYPGWTQQVGTAAIGGGNATASINWQIPAGGATGTYHVHIRAVDALGVWDWNGSVMASFTVSAPEPPAITTHPSSQTVSAGQSVTFTVAASGAAPLGYQWRKNGTAIGGANSSTYTIADTQAADAAGYSVVVSNSVNSVASDTATLTVNAVAPSITTQPVSQTVNAGQAVSFSVAASGSAPLSYEWRKNGSAISSANAATYSIANAQPADAGNYSVVVSNGAGSVTSATAALAVNLVAPSISSHPASQTINAGNGVTFNVVASGTAPLSYQWRKNGVNISGANASAYSIANVQTSDAAGYTVVVSNSVGSVASTTATLTVTTLQPIRLAIKYWQANDWPGIQVDNYDDVWVEGHDEEEGYHDEEGNWVVTGSHWVEGHWESHYTGTTTYPDGQYGHTWTTTAGTFDIASAASGYNPSATQRGHFVHSYQPGNKVTFHVFGTAPSANCNDYTWTLYNPWGGWMAGNWFNPSFAWSFDAPWTGTYRIDVTYQNANATPGTATVSYYIPVGVTPPPAIVTQPTPATQTVPSGATVTYTVAASGAPSYQWTKDGSAISGANATTLTLANVQPASSGSYALIATNSAGTATSNTVMLTVQLIAPGITTQPANQTVNAGQTATFAVVASGSTPLSYQWRKNGADIAAATNASYSIASAQSGDAAAYSVVVSNSAGSATSATAALAVNLVAPSISSHPASQTINAGNGVTFNVVASGTAPLSYQWRKNGVNISGANASAYSIANVQTSDAAGYTVVVSNSVGSVASTTATLTVTTLQPIRLGIKYWQANDWPGIQVDNYDDVWVEGHDEEEGYHDEGGNWVVTGSHWVEGQWESHYTGTTTYPDGQYGHTWTTTAGTFDIASAASGYNPSATQRGHFVHSYQPGNKVTFHVFGTAPSANCNDYTWTLYNPWGGWMAGNWFNPSFAWSFDAPWTGTYRIDVTYQNANATPGTATVSYYISVGVGIPPQITVQPNPATQTVNAGNSVSYSVAATNVTSLQWYKDNVAIPGATLSTLALSNVQASSGGAYQVIASNSHGSTSSNIVTLTVNVPPPVFTTQPSPATQTVSAGAHVTYSAVATGAASYQWFKDGVAISGATAASLSLTAVQPANSGSYALVATNSAGSVTSSVVYLTVNSGSGDTTSPTAPGSLAAPNVTSTTVALTWTASTDNVSVAGYAIYRGSTQVAAVVAGTLSFTDSGLTLATNYTYTVRAFDAAGNYSTPSNAVPVTTLNIASQNDSANQNQLNLLLPVLP